MGAQYDPKLALHGFAVELAIDVRITFLPQARFDSTHICKLTRASEFESAFKRCEAPHRRKTHRMRKRTENPFCDRAPVAAAPSCRAISLGHRQRSDRNCH